MFSYLGFEEDGSRRFINPALIHFTYLRYLSVKELFIELDKLVRTSKNQKNTVEKLLQECVSVNVGQKETLLRDLHAKDELIERIKLVRDKYYAHSDPNAFEVPNFLPAEVSELIQFVTNILYAVYGKEIIDVLIGQMLTSQLPYQFLET